MGRDERDRVRHRVLSDPHDPVTQVVDAILAEVPAYRSLHGTQLPEVRAIAQWTLTRALELWVEETSFSAADLARFRGIGGARAADGRSLPAVLRAYRVGAAAADRLIARGCGDLLAPEDVFALNQLWLTGLDALSEALFSGYSETSTRLSGDRAQARRALLDDLVVGRQSSPGAVVDRTRALGVTLAARGLLLVAETVGDDPGVSPEAAAGAAGARLLGALEDADGGIGDDLLLTVRGHRVVVLLPEAAAGGVGPALRGLGWRGCLTGAHPLTELARAYRLASDALDGAPERAYDDTGLLHEADARVVALLCASPDASPEAVRHHVLGPLTTPGNEHLLAALSAFLDTGSAAAAATVLHLHPQTLRYRLRRVRALTGRDPRHPWQRLTLDIARSADRRHRPVPPVREERAARAAETGTAGSGARG
ncbi:PucR family transcriptional regulator [Nocardiopsis ansamitocini]|uniref:PucR family transcriptional regulator n=1 Tax=Nocardiopsis ansamitocini TaxID=1670832 RepID=A0A9W6PA27_9ACTN|nr:PucR family transcriptional regulator [Nocardiopsis ansamitocini]GLU49886.1 hypothetical protein Nans01_42370 [Nocardiopsis ansamitocini]